MGFKKTLVVAAVSFWIGTHYSSRFYEEAEKFEEMDYLIGDAVKEVDGSWGQWAEKLKHINALTNGTVRAKLLEFYRTLGEKDHPEPGLMQSEADRLYRFAFDKGWSAASEDKANVGRQYQKLFGTVTAEEVQSEMRGG